MEHCLNDENSPIDKDTVNNLKFLIGLRNEIEHQMTSRIDDLLSARFQACCLNYNDYLKKLFGNDLGIENHLSFSLQFSTIKEEHKELLSEQKHLPAHILSYIEKFDGSLSDYEYSSSKYAYRIFFVPKTANSKGQADRVIEFIKNDSPLAEDINKSYALVKETEKQKYLPAQIVSIMNSEGYKKFNMRDHTNLWQQCDAKNPQKGFGTLVAGKQWHYYENWLNHVREYCKKHQEKFK